MSRKNYRILQIDDQPEFHKQMRYVFGDRFEFEGVVNEIRLEEKIKSKLEFDIVLLDLVLDDSNEFKGLDLIPKIRKNWPDIPIIVITQDKQKSTVVRAMKAGANNFLEKSDFDLEFWEQVFLEAIEQKEVKEELKSKLKKEVKSKEELQIQLTKVQEDKEFTNPINSPFIGNSDSIKELKRSLKFAANSQEVVTVMLNGETGVGKGVAARFLHANSSVRKNKPFQEINISSIPKDLVPSQLFGHKKGSFTGAIDDQKGRLELANHGIVFLDEIGELDLENQVKILNFLQDKTITPLGGDKPIKLDVQILAATNKDLWALVENGLFREDLYHRLDVFSVFIPPLRDHREDILPLLAYFMKCTEDEVYTQLEPDVMKFMVDEYLWSGNIRELENTVLSMNIRRKSLGLPKFNKACLPKRLFQNNAKNLSSVSTVSPDIDLLEGSENEGSLIFKTLDEEIAYKKLKAIEDALILKNGVKGDVAALLNYKSDDNLRYGIEKLLKGYPHLAKYFPAIQENYHRMIKKLGI